MTKHIHDLEFMVGTKNIICMNDSCYLSIDRDEILEMVDLLAKYFETHDMEGGFGTLSFADSYALLSKIWQLYKENYENFGVCEDE